MVLLDKVHVNLEDQTPQLIGHHKTREKGLKNHGEHGWMWDMRWIEAERLYL
jgi:hypothetical protein